MRSVWLTESRYYHVSIISDLLGDWVLVRHWGGRHSRRGGQKTTYLCTRQMAEQAYKRICAARLRRGYWEAPAGTTMGVDERRRTVGHEYSKTR